MSDEENIDAEVEQEAEAKQAATWVKKNLSKDPDIKESEE